MATCRARVIAINAGETAGDTPRVSWHNTNEEWTTRRGASHAWPMRGRSRRPRTCRFRPPSSRRGLRTRAGPNLESAFPEPVVEVHGARAIGEVRVSERLPLAELDA